MNYVEQQTVHRIKNLANSLDAPPPPPEKSPYLGLSEKEQRDYSIIMASRILHAAASGHLGASRLRGLEGLGAECHTELVKRFGPAFSDRTFYVPQDVLEYRAMAPSPASKGGFLIGVEALSFIDQLQNASAALALGSPIINHPGPGNVALVKQLAGPTYTWIVPGSGASATDPTFGQSSATAHTVLSITEISEQLDAQQSPMAEFGVRRNLALGLAAAAEAALVSGTGGVQPLGVTNTPGINTVVGTSLDRAKAIDMQKQAVDANAVVNPDTQGYLTTPTVAAAKANLQEFTGVASTLWSGSIARGAIVGLPARSTKAMGAGQLLFGDFSQLALCQFGPMQIAVNVADFNKATLAIRALWMVDTICLEPKAFTLASSVT